MQESKEVLLKRLWQSKREKPLDGVSPTSNLIDASSQTFDVLPPASFGWSIQHGTLQDLLPPDPESGHQASVCQHLTPLYQRGLPGVV